VAAAVVIAAVAIITQGKSMAAKATVAPAAPPEGTLAEPPHDKPL